MKMKNLLAETIVDLFESKKVYMNEDYDFDDLVKDLKEDYQVVSGFFKEEMDYSFQEMLSIYRGRYKT